jgi:3-hydroxymyristoyl/3-hydroxydecanoyl-(acyl carrier protein) dehydratase
VEDRGGQVSDHRVLPQRVPRVAQLERPLPRLRGAGQVGFRHFVQPGDQLELTVTLKSRTDDSAELSGEVKVDGKLVTRARRLTLVPAA